MYVCATIKYNTPTKSRNATHVLTIKLCALPGSARNDLGTPQMEKEQALFSFPCARLDGNDETPREVVFGFAGSGRNQQQRKQQHERKLFGVQEIDQSENLRAPFLSLGLDDRFRRHYYYSTSRPARVVSPSRTTVSIEKNQPRGKHLHQNMTPPHLPPPPPPPPQPPLAPSQPSHM